MPPSRLVKKHGTRPSARDQIDQAGASPAAGVAVVQSVNDYEVAEEERAAMRAVVAGLADLEAGRDLSLAEAKARLGLK